MQTTHNYKIRFHLGFTPDILQMQDKSPSRVGLVSGNFLHPVFWNIPLTMQFSDRSMLLLLPGRCQLGSRAISHHSNFHHYMTQNS